MCAICSTTNIPVCALDGSCGTGLNQSIHMVMLMGGPVLGATFFTIKTKISNGKNRVVQKIRGSGNFTSKYVITRKRSY